MVDGWVNEAFHRAGEPMPDYSADFAGALRLLWIAAIDKVVFGAAVTRLDISSGRKLCVIEACGGIDFNRWKSAIATIEAYGKAEGAEEIVIEGRTGWTKFLPDYHVAKVTLRKVL